MQDLIQEVGLKQFFNNPFLSDIEITHSESPDKIYKLHKVILSSGSKYFYKLLTDNPTISSHKLPTPILSTSQKHEDYAKIIEVILESFYNYSNSSILSFKIDKSNCFIFYSIALSMDNQQALLNFQSYILSNLTGLKDSFNLILDGLKFKNDIFCDQGRRIIQENINKVLQDEIMVQKLIELPYSEFFKIFGQGDLQVDSENYIFQIICDYIRWREKLESLVKKDPENPEQEASQRLQNYKLTFEEKDSIMNCIKLSFVDPKKLLQCSSDPIFEKFLKKFMEGITGRLSFYEKEGDQEIFASMTSRQNIQVQNQIQQTQSNIEVPNKKNQNQGKGLSQQNTEKTKAEQDKIQDSTSKSNLKAQQVQYKETKKEFQYQQPIDEDHIYSDRRPNNESDLDIGISSSKYQINIGGSRVTKDLITQKKNSIQFVYEQDMDENGVIYYLATNGRTKKFTNPHASGQLKIFLSSKQQGNLEDIVSRQVMNVYTQNIKNSFIGVDLGYQRYLSPTCYTIINRNSTTHVMLNWVMEGSNNFEDWFILDKRIHFSQDNPVYNEMMQRERDILICKGSTSTWGIDQTSLKKFFAENFLQEKGFRYFRITQLFQNSSNTHHLCLSGIEIYGEAYGPRWSNFNV